MSHSRPGRFAEAEYRSHASRSIPCRRITLAVAPAEFVVDVADDGRVARVLIDLDLEHPTNAKSFVLVGHEPDAGILG
jgi:hypothetical protein